MRKSKRMFRLAMLGLLCGGLLLTGVGAGVCFAEASAFSYGGRQLLAQAQPRSQTLRVKLVSGNGKIQIDSYSGLLLSRLREVGRIEESEDVEAGTAEVRLEYESVGMEIGYSINRTQGGQQIDLYWTNHGQEAALLMAYKDQVLADVKERRLSDYIPAELTAAVITVNPADAERVVLG